MEIIGLGQSLLRIYEKKKKMLEKSWFPEMHHIWKKYFPDVVPKQFGIGGFFTLVDKKGDAHTIFTDDVKNPMGRILWNEILPDDFTIDKIKFATYYTKTQYWDLL